MKRKKRPFDLNDPDDEDNSLSQQPLLKKRKVNNDVTGNMNNNNMYGNNNNNNMLNNGNNNNGMGMGFNNNNDNNNGMNSNPNVMFSNSNSNNSNSNNIVFNNGMNNNNPVNNNNVVFNNINNGPNRDGIYHRDNIVTWNFSDPQHRNHFKNLNRIANNYEDEDEEISDVIQIHVKKINGDNVTFSLLDTCSVYQLKTMLYEQYSIQIITQRLVFGGRVLGDNSQLKEHGIKDGSVIHLVFHMRGGCGKT